MSLQPDLYQQMCARGIVLFSIGFGKKGNPQAKTVPLEPGFVHLRGRILFQLIFQEEKGIKEEN